MIAHSFTIDPVWCADHGCFEQALRVNTYDTGKAHGNPQTVVYPLHGGGLQQLFLNVVNHVGSAYIPNDPKTPA